MKLKITTVVLVSSVIMMGAAFGFATADLGTHETQPTESTYLTPPTSEPPTTTSSTTAPQLAPATSIVRPALKASTTTTSEVPPRLTAEQEAKIPSADPTITPAGEIDPSVPSTDAKIQWCIDTHQDLGDCKLPESEGMSDENATDYNLPN